MTLNRHLIVSALVRRGSDILLIEQQGPYAATTFACEATGALAPDDPDGYVRRAACVPADEAIRRLRQVDWYDSSPIEAFLGGAHR